MADTRVIVKALQGRWFGSYGTCLCPAHNNTNRHSPALSVSKGRGGKLLVHCFAGCAYSDIMAALCERGLVETSERHDFAPHTHAYDREDEARRLASAQRVREGTRLPAGTAAERYAQRRAIQKPLPWPTVGFHPRLRHPSGGYHPAIVSVVTKGSDNRFCGVAREWITLAGEKPRLEPSKAMLGPCTGGAVRLSEGPGPLIVGEGLWTCLSLRDALQGSVWAALSTSGLKQLILPREPGDLIIGADHDANGAGEKAAEELAARASRAGWFAKIIMPEALGTDWNDVAMAALEVRDVA
ncbi:MAG: toprim domain-containing protein [Pseudomonadota bacterium]